ncbi:ComEA family DNA-binding protein [Siccibacter turicensis]|uniref:ComEA family DNA-binding protein n=1 Tax=Siccibacter turicensis TaxID=357233 RepID=UPI0023F481CA|nr:helix-hairpin-helix domain-containing protein [Siccibacter turicensis]MDY0970597.1 helix-hairpin-helix domain-containing protein [Siccibacter turicensis]
MKPGFNAFFITLAMMMSSVCYTASAASSTAAKSDASHPQATMAAKGETRSATPPVMAQEKQVSDDETVSINTATAEELAQALNGVGAKKAQAIVSYREEYGPFKSLEDLKQVPGMGNALVERNMAHLKL